MKGWFSVLILCGIPGLTANAIEINGTVRSASDKYATVVSESDLVPSPGDKVEIFFKLPGADDEISVANGHVYEITGANIMVEIEKATGTVAKDQLVRIKSAKALKKRGVNPSPRPPPPLQSTPAVSPGDIAEEPIDVGQMASKTVTFENLQTGALPMDAFAKDGIRFKEGKGKPGVYTAEPNMFLPPPCKKVLLLAGERVTSLTIRLDPPVKRFALYRIGTAGGASTPTWTMMAYNRKGDPVGATGEGHSLPSRPMYYGIDAEGIVRVELSTDNRYGGGTWATWNSLPIAGFGFDR